eukprot:jgi/Chlat1/4292/Chrsp29S04555
MAAVFATASQHAATNALLPEATRAPHRPLRSSRQPLTRSRGGGGVAKVRAMVALRVEKWDEAKHGQLSADRMARLLASEGYSVQRYTFRPGTVFSGKSLVVVLEPGDMLDVPAGATHYAEVVGDEPVVFFDASK